MRFLNNARFLPTICTFALVALAAPRMTAEPPAPGHYTVIQFPGSVYTNANAINSQGQIAGDYFGSNGPAHNFVYDRGVYTTINTPGDSSVTGINNEGQIVGIIYQPLGLIYPHGFLYENGASTVISVPGSVGTMAYGINNRGQVSGWYLDNNYDGHGFVYEKGKYTTFSLPGAFETYAYSLNDHGQVVGYWLDTDFTVLHGFIYDVDKGIFTDLFFPGSQFLERTGQTFAAAINDSGLVVGNYNLESDNVDLTQHGYVYDRGVYTSFDAPGAGTGGYVGTYFTGINNKGQIIGRSVGNIIVFPDHTEVPSYSFLLTR
jgi:uncharacterized membrane protein